MLKLKNTTDRVLTAFLLVGIVFVAYTLIGKVGYNKKDKEVLNLKSSQEDDLSNKVTSGEKILLEGGKVWVVFSKQELKSEEEVEIKIYVDTAGENLGAFGMNFNFNTDNIKIDTKKGDAGVGLDTGKDLVDLNDIPSADYIADSNELSSEGGKYRIVGIPNSTLLQEDVYATGENIHIATVYAKAVTDFKIDLKFDWLELINLSNHLGHSFDILKINEGIEVR